MKTGQQLGTEICKALGIDAQEVARISIICDPGEAAIVVAEMYVRDDAGKVAKAFRRYELVLKSESIDPLPI